MVYRLKAYGTPLMSHYQQTIKTNYVYVNILLNVAVLKHFWTLILNKMIFIKNVHIADKQVYGLQNENDVFVWQL